MNSQASATVNVPVLAPDCWMLARQLAERVCLGPPCEHRARIEVLDVGSGVQVTGVCEAAS